MADAIVSIVLRNLSDAAVKEVLQQRGVAEQVETVCRELSRIHSFIGDAETKQMGDNKWRNWAEEVRDVSYDLEDVVDTYLSEVPPKESDELECEIDQILARLQEISNSMVQYGIDNFGGKSTCEVGLGQLSGIRPAVASEIGNPDVVGFDADKEYICNNMVKFGLEGTPSLSVVAIVGPAGIGKTTLASQIYNSVEVHRAYGTACVWVTIPQAFSLLKVYLKILEKLESMDGSGWAEDEDSLVDYINYYLKGKKFFLVLDNVQSADLWKAIQRALPDDHNGSRVLMTTTNLAIAEHADTSGQPYKLHFLTEDISLQLLLRKALPIYQDPIEECPKNLSNLAKQFVKQCGGLPLALVVLGGILSKTSEYEGWSKLLKMINWNANVENQCIEIIATSYEHLPAVLKPCFMYFAAFPKDFDIRAKSLIRMWVAEGFIPQGENETLEETATGFLEDFVQRNMVQVTKRAYDGSIKQCHIHSVLRDVAIEKARDNKFLAVCSNPDEQQNCHEARRLAVHDAHEKSNEIMKKANINLRSLILFNSDLPNCSQLKVLRVLSHLGPEKINFGAKLETQRLEGCTQLRYFELPYCYKSDCFNELISRMKFVQTLDLPYVRERYQIDDIWHIKTMRHVMIGRRMFYDDFVFAPLNWAELTNIQTLHGVKYGLYYPYDLYHPETPESPNMPNLHDLRIEFDWNFDSEKFVEYLSTLKHLVSLQMVGQTAPSEMFDMVSRCPFFQNLKSLELCYRGLGLYRLSFAMFPTNLTKVKLMNFELSNDPMAELEKLPVLKILKFEGPGFWDHVMRCSAGGFPKLEKLKLSMDCLYEWEWEIENGAMPMLQQLEICHFDGLCVPIGLQYLSSLRRLDWTLYEHRDNSPNKAKLIRELCKHVPYISLINFEKKIG
ncbi:hypothetical protein LUZ61_013244 [Rhynchospora tenuis]|uniref:AAA+ ATPase domain-containing protein n=1 Tax=Rhynchospora tenuis TaxID=198213 RepID=A0AAD5YZS7_9POAL|nr:hypothetical protein LUZ61_013244 [Rhynchospora tenuis]